MPRGPPTTTTSKNRLGFYDSLSDIKQGPLAYLVCGWYSNPDRDPLGAAQIKSLSDFYAKMAEFQWKLDDNELEQSHTKSWNFVSAATQLGLATREATAVGTISELRRRLSRSSRRACWRPRER